MITHILTHIYANFFAFVLPLLLFVYWGIIGYSVLSILYSQRNHLQNLLLAPTIGLSINVVSVFFLCWLGLPVKNFAFIISTLFILFSLVILYLKKPLFPYKRYFVFASIICIALCITGFPLLKYGFNWLSFGNDDMSNYAFGALWFLNHGYNSPISVNELLSGRDYSTYYWFMYVAGMERAGSELMLSWLSGVTHFKTLQLFMPLIVALNLTLISSATALVYQSKFWRPVAIAFCLLLVVSALQALGVFYQLIAQIFGISLFLAVVTIWFKPYRFSRFSRAIKYAFLLGILLASITISYPEVTPFIAVGYLFFIGFSYRRRFYNRYYLAFLGFAAVFTLILINSYVMNYFVFLYQQALVGNFATKSANSIFPYILVPSGLANLWNIFPISQHISEPWLSFGILLGGMLLVIAPISAYLQMKRKLLPTSIICFVMLVLGSLWFMNSQGFVLFKLSMYLQPFLLATFVITCFFVFSKRFFLKIPVWLIPIILLSVASFNSELYYLERSAGSPGNFVELPNASKQKLVANFSHVLENLDKKTTVFLATTNYVPEKLQPLLSYEYPVFLISRNVFLDLMEAFWVPLSIKKVVNPTLYSQARQIVSGVQSHYEKVSFNLHTSKSPDQDSFYLQKDIPQSQNIAFSMDPLWLSIFNHWKSDEQNTLLLSNKEAKNLLVYINSKLSQNYYLGDYDFISLYGIQKDYFYPQQTFCGVGRFLLFRLINPTPNPRIVFNYTASLNPDRKTQLPIADFIGNERKTIPVLGFGSARVSIPVTPQWINGKPYLMLDMKNDGNKYTIPRHGLMRLYGENIALDYRTLNAYVRDLSLISEQDFQNRDVPTSINKFPEDLANKNLMYSGIYEEGWVGNRFYVDLKQLKHNNLLSVRGLYPLLDNQSRKTKVEIDVDGKTVLATTLKPSEFDFKILLPDNPGTKRITMRFSDLFPLPGGDRRFVSAKINSIEFHQLYS
jgi:hypothetical protein